MLAIVETLQTLSLHLHKSAAALAQMEGFGAHGNGSLRLGLPDALGRAGGGGEQHWWWLFLALFIVVAVVGNAFVCAAVAWDPRLRKTGTNKFIASLAVSDFLVGALVMPFALHIKVAGDEWRLSEGLCRFHLSTAAFSTTASIIHLVAISVDRYFAIIFPTEYQRHSTQTSTTAYVVVMWVVAGAISATALLEPLDTQHRICWLKDPQYLILSSLMSFLLPASVVCYLYVKIFKKLKRHLALSFLRRRMPTSGQTQRPSLPQVVVEEVRSRRGSWLSMTRERSNSQGSKGSRTSGRSASQPDIGPDLLELNALPASLTALERVWDASSKEELELLAASIAQAKDELGFRSGTICETALSAPRAADEEVGPSVPPLQPSELTEPTAPLDVLKWSPERRRKVSPASMWRSAVARAGKLRQASAQRRRSSPGGAGGQRIRNGGVKTGEQRAPLMGTAGASLNVPALHVPASRLLSPPSSGRSAKKAAAALLAVPDQGGMGAGGGGPRGSIAEDGESVGPQGCGASVSTGSSRSSDDVRSSIVSFGSSLTEDTDYADCSRRPSALSGVSDVGDGRGSPGSAKRRISSMTPGKLRAIAGQVTRAIRRKRRESLAIRRETRATRLVAAILVVFILCWLPFFCAAVYRGIALGSGWRLNQSAHIHVYLVTSWLGYLHSCANPFIYTCLNRNFRNTFKKLLRCNKRKAASNDVFSNEEDEEH